MKNKKNYLLIYGKHACFSVLEFCNREIYKIYLTSQRLLEIKKFINKNFEQNIEIKNNHELNKISKIEDKHQGIVMEISELQKNNQDLKSVLKKEKNLILLLDQIQDPNNLGNIIRTAFGFGIETIVLSKENSCPITAAVIRSSVGYSEKINIIYMNISQAIIILKENNFWIFATDSHATTNLSIENIVQKYQKTAFIFGSEGDGVREQIKKNSDFLVKIPISKEVESLNVSTAVTIIAYEWYKKMN